MYHTLFYLTIRWIRKRRLAGQLYISLTSVLTCYRLYLAPIFVLYDRMSNAWPFPWYGCVKVSHISDAHDSDVFLSSTPQELTPEAEIVNVCFTKSVIASKAAFTYEEAQIRKDDPCVNVNVLIAYVDSHASLWPETKKMSLPRAFVCLTRLREN